MHLISKLAALSVAVVLTAPAHADPVNLVNAGFENNWSSAQYGSDGHVTFNYVPTGPNMGWTFTGGGGVAGSYDYLHAYEGNQFAFLQLVSSMSQSFSLASSASATLDFALALRPGYMSGQTVSVLIDDHQIANFAATSSAWASEHVNLGWLSAGSHKLSFTGNANYYVTGDTTAYVDDVKISVSPVPMSPVPEPETYAMLLAGFGLLGFTARRKKNRAA